MKEVFISYAREDFETANKLYDDLKNFERIVPWIDKTDILPGQNWKISVKQAINRCSYFLLLLSSHSVSKKGYVQKEQKIALELLDERPVDSIFIIPIKLDETEVTDERLSNLHWVNFYPSYEKGLLQILRVLTSKMASQDSQEIQENRKSVDILFDITGIWECNDGGTYYITQINDKIFWYGEQRHDMSKFCNVAFGNARGNEITIEWADVPKGKNQYFGNMVLQVLNNASRIKVVKKEGGMFSGNIWDKTGIK
ncbi:MAG: TIR domain-containing protein [Desulfobacterales bacterium]|nr:TIR domain-containing protein [Desulfobacterales bacterium]